MFNMKTFKQFICEQKQNEAPRGVIFDDNKAIVGKEHEKPLILSDDLVEKIKKIGDNYGYWYEGNGGDVESSRPLPNNKKDYKGSFDENFANSIKDEPPEFYYLIFSNVTVNHNIRRVTNPHLSIFNSLLHGYTENNKKYHLYYLGQVTPKDVTLKNFLEMISDNEYDFVQMSKMMATKENTTEFLRVGEKRMWPKDWEKYPYNAGKVAKKASDKRDKYLVDQKEGVYVVGSGHLTGILELDKSLEMIGGEMANK